MLESLLSKTCGTGLEWQCQPGAAAEAPTISSSWETTQLLPQHMQLWNLVSNHRPVPSHKESHLLPPKAVLVLVGDQAASQEVVAYSTPARKEVLLPPANSGQAKQLINFKRKCVCPTLTSRL